jgi:hypothetical protein
MPAESSNNPWNSGESPNLNDFGPQQSLAGPYSTPNKSAAISEVDLEIKPKPKPKQQPEDESIASTERSANSADKGGDQSIGTGGGDETSTASTAA